LIPLEKAIRFLIAGTITFVFFCPGAADAATGEIEDYWNGDVVWIPDNGGNSGNWGRVSLDVAGAPAGATITGVDVYYEVKHNYTGDLRVWVTTDYGGGNWKDYVVWDRQGGSGDNIAEWKTGITKWNGANADRTWWLVAGDYDSGVVGYLDFFEVHVHWYKPDPTSTVDIYVENVNGSKIEGTVVHLAGDVETTDTSGKAHFTSVPYGAYNYEVYYNGTGTEEFWGNDTINVDSPTESDTFRRNWPYKYDETLPDDPMVGQTVTINVKAKNNLSFSRNVKVELWVDRDKSSGWDYRKLSSAQSISGGGRIETFTFDDIRPTYSGTYYYRVHVLSWNDGASNYIATDTSSWVTAFEAQEAIDVSLVSADFRSVYRKGEEIIASFVLHNDTASPLENVFLNIIFESPDGSSIGGIDTLPFTIDGNSDYGTSDIPLWNIPLSADSGAYLPVILLKNSAGDPLLTFTCYNTNEQLPVLAVGDFPVLNNVIVKSQQHFSRIDPGSVDSIIGQFANAGIDGISLLIKLDDGEGQWGSLSPLPGQVLFNSSSATASAGSPLAYDLLSKALMAGLEDGVNVDIWIPTFFDHAAIQDHPSWKLDPDPRDEGFIDAYLEDVRNYERDIIVNAITTPYSAPKRLYLDHFRFLNDQQHTNTERITSITSFVEAVHDVIPSSTELAGYVWLPGGWGVGDTWWSGQDYSSLDPYLDVFSPMLYWNWVKLAPGEENIPRAARAWVGGALDNIEQYVSSSKVAPVFPISSGLDFAGIDGDSVVLDFVTWKRAQLNVLGVAADKGIVEYDLFYWQNWFYADEFEGGGGPAGYRWVDWARHFGEIAQDPNPPRPQNLLATDGTHAAKIEVTWDDVSGEDGYRVYRAISPGGTYSEIGSTTAGDTNYHDSCGCGKTYWYRVRAYNSGGESGDSNSNRGNSQSCPTYSLTTSVSPSGGGSVTKNPNKSSYNLDESVQLTAHASSGYTFSHWSGDASGSSNPINVTMNSNKSVTGNFTITGSSDIHVEQFTLSGDTFDLSNKAILFTPKVGDSYDVCVQAITQLPTNPSGGTSLSLGDDSSTSVNVLSGQTVWLYGSSFSTFYVGSNGYITFTQGDGDFSESIDDHFDTKRISVLFDDLNPARGGTISWRQLPDRVVVTWQNVPEYGQSTSNTFQVEMYFSGEIRLAWLTVAVQDGLVGLSEGVGTPAGFQESDFSETTACSQTMVTVPNVVGLSQGSAEAGITSAGLVVGSETFAYSHTVAAGRVVSQSPAGGASVAIGSSVNLVISGGPTIYVDGVTGDDSQGTGAQTSPYETVAKALEVASNGDKIIILAGSYPENLTMNKAVTIEARGGVVRIGQ